MVSHTYTTLSTEVLNYTEDDSDEFAASLPYIIKNAQERVVRELDLEIFKQTYEGTFTASTNFQTKPTELLTISSIYYYDPDEAEWNLVLPRSYDFCRLYAGSGKPKYYDEGFSDTQIYLVRLPNIAYSYNIRGLRRPDYISPTKEDNWISKFAGDLLFYASLVESEGFLMSAQTGKTQEWEAEYQKRIISAKNELAQIARHEYSPMANSAEPRNDS